MNYDFNEISSFLMELNDYLINYYHLETDIKFVQLEDNIEITLYFGDSLLTNGRIEYLFRIWLNNTDAWKSALQSILEQNKCG